MLSKSERVAVTENFLIVIFFFQTPPQNPAKQPNQPFKCTHLHVEKFFCRILQKSPTESS